MKGFHLRAAILIGVATSDVAVHCIVATNSNCNSNQLRLVVKSVHGDGRNA